MGNESAYVNKKKMECKSLCIRLIVKKGFGSSKR